MDAIEKRARERARFDAWVKASGSYSWNGFNRMEDMWDAWQAALTPPEGYVLVPMVPTKAMVDASVPAASQDQTGRRQRAVWDAMLAARPEVP
ncbi:hypothetical protein [Pseudomonas aeruginosa]|uniref:hypothetical protein n=1 Tax=Pseudomonas aeruginosa TaxID=287 RepID=UPI003896C732